jgi:hypothetical protein
MSATHWGTEIVNIATLILEFASVAFFVWGGLLTLRCAFQAPDSTVPNREHRLAEQTT